MKNIFDNIKSIKSNAGGRDEILGLVFRTHASHFSYPLSIIFNIRKPLCYGIMQMFLFLKASPISEPSLVLILLLKFFENAVLTLIIFPLSNFFPIQFAFISSNITAATNALTMLRLNILNHLTNNDQYVRFIVTHFLKAFNNVSLRLHWSY